MNYLTPSLLGLAAFLYSLLKGDPFLENSRPKGKEFEGEFVLDSPAFRRFYDAFCKEMHNRDVIPVESNYLFYLGTPSPDPKFIADGSLSHSDYIEVVPKRFRFLPDRDYNTSARSFMIDWHLEGSDDVKASSLFCFTDKWVSLASPGYGFESVILMGDLINDEDKKLSHLIDSFEAALRSIECGCGCHSILLTKTGDLLRISPDFFNKKNSNVLIAIYFGDYF